MRILLTCLSDFRAAGARQTLRLAAALEEAGHTTLVLIEGDVGTIRFASERALGLDVDRYEFSGPVITAATRRRAAGFSPDVVHCYEPRTAPLSASLQISRREGCPLLVRFADDDDALAREAGGTGLRGLVGRPCLLAAGTLFPGLWPYRHPLLFRLMRRRAAGYDAITPMLAEAITSRYGIPCEAILPAMLRKPPPSRQPGIRARLGLPEDAVLVTYTGSVYRAQYPDFELLLRGFARLAHRQPDVHLVHSGRIAHRYRKERLLELAGAGSGRTHFLGFLEDPVDVDGLLAESAVLVQPGAPTDFNRLRLPAKVPEYLLSGRPTITFGVGFGELLEDRRNAVLTEGPEPEELASAIEWVLADPDKAAAVGKRGREKARELFDPAAAAAQTIALYESAK